MMAPDRWVRAPGWSANHILFGDSLLISLSKLCRAEAMPEISKLSPKSQAGTRMDKPAPG
jgi:hypothetical protein